MDKLQIKHAVILVLVVVVAMFVYASATVGITAVWEVLPPANYRPTKESTLNRSSQSIATRSWLRQSIDASSTATSTLPKNKTQVEIIARPPVTPADIVIASRTEGADITRGAFVWTSEKTTFGTIADVRDQTVTIELFSRAGKSTPALLGGAVPINLVGFGGRDFRVDIPENTPTREGDVIVSDEFNVPIGVVAATEDAEALGKKRVFITSLVPLFEIETLYVESN